MSSIDISEEIKNKRSGSHYIKLEDKELLKEQLKILKQENVFNKYQMSYTYTELEDCILLIIHKQVDFIN